MKKISFTLFLVVVLLLATTLVRNPQTVTTSPTPTSTVAPTEPQTVLGQTTKITGCVETSGMPDGACTPGDIDSRVTQENINSTICVSGYTTTVRPPVSVTNKIKTERMAAYGDTDSPSNYELDHLISLELGGNPSTVANLWPEPYTSELNAHQKDKVENYLHDQVCKGIIPLAKAQDEIAHDWESVYRLLPSK